MKGDHIKYIKIKYSLAEDYSVTNGHLLQTPVKGFDIDIDFIRLTPDGMLDLKRGFACDGPSGPTFDTLDSMRGAFSHDAFYHLMRIGKIPLSFRPVIDEFLETICKEDGMLEIRAEVWHEGVKDFAEYAALPESEPEILIAP